uniref:Hemicentin-1 n=1 Tax=Cacopsylla melanoneura TaxID=428564 RepID=A0A8D8W7X6_9HEMI
MCNMISSLTVCFLSVVISVRGSNPIMEHDTHEGEDFTLECRFPPHLSSQEPTLYWLRTNRRNHDNVAIRTTPFDKDYKIDYRPDSGRYDLIISNASFERDNGKFECRLKAAGSGQDLHSQVYTVTVLTPPQLPKISPGSNPVATEGRVIELVCSTSGGSPDPQIRWYKEGVRQPLDSSIKVGTDKDATISAVLSYNPSRTDDGAVFRCVVWNRAMPEGAKLEAKTTLSVNYFPRVEIGPENPLRLEKEGSVTLQCIVDAKPRVNSVRWERNGRFIATTFTYALQKVTAADAGEYTCSADNGLGQPGEAVLNLDVQYGPQVVIESGGQGVARTREIEDGESVTIHCNATSNPPPITVEWLREGRPDFRQSGNILRLHRVSADSAGTYTCRASNVLTPSSLGKQRVNKSANASVTLLVRHRPGEARISPDKPVVLELASATLSCLASPPGWPMPQYRWWRDNDDSQSGNPTVLATGPKLQIPSAHLGSEGKYHCQATNEMGHGGIGTVHLTVHQAPTFTLKLQPHITKRASDSDFSVSCAAQGKPKPLVKWMKDGREISSKLFEIATEESEDIIPGRNTYIVKSVLRFSGRDRPGGNQLIPADRGDYSCAFENEVHRTESIMHLRIEHEPIVLQKHNKVAYELNDNAVILCEVQAYPRPEFHWSLNNNPSPLTSSGSKGHYEINTSVSEREGAGDVYISNLTISNIKDYDYGDYNCRVINTLGSVRVSIKLQTKGPPEKPEALHATDVGPRHVVLEWMPGFDGGLKNTKYFVSYKKVLRTNDNEIDNDCYASKRLSNVGDSWQEFDCQVNNPCNVTSLEQHQSYVFKMKAYNPKGHSNYSDEAVVMTRVERIPQPQRVTFDPETHALVVNLAATCLQLVGIVEAITDPTMNLADENDWQQIQSIPLIPSGSSATRREATVLSLVSRRRNSNGRALEEDFVDDAQESIGAQPVVTGGDVRVRVKLCLASDHSVCGDTTEAELGPAFIKEATSFSTPTLVALCVSLVIFILFVALIFVFCKCKKKQTKKNGKDYDMNSTTENGKECMTNIMDETEDGRTTLSLEVPQVPKDVHPSIVQHAPPPYYPSGMENKGLEHSMDLALDEQGKPMNVVGPTYNGYHTPNQTPGEWMTMGYMTNSYSNSNNGGSVNSQDSLWQMKMASAHHNQQQAPQSDTRSQYGAYDPLTHGGYGVLDDYAQYRGGGNTPDAYSNAPPSRQDFGPPDKRLRQLYQEPTLHLGFPSHSTLRFPVSTARREWSTGSLPRPRAPSRVGGEPEVTGSASSAAPSVVRRESRVRFLNTQL